MSKTICLYFQVHQPDRLRQYRFFDIGNNSYYYDDFTNKSIIKRVAKESYLPTNALLLNLLNKYKGKFKVTFSISGVVIEQFEKYTPEVIESFKKLAATGDVEFLAETYSHSLSSLISPDEFRSQVKRHSNLMKKLFGKVPTAFRNTELIYSDEIGHLAYKMGYKTMLAEGAKQILGWKSPNYIYSNAINSEMKLLLRNFSLSDDIAFRFSDQSSQEWPITSEKYVGWLKEACKNDDILNLFIDYETFGEHQKVESGIFDFLKALPNEIINNSDFEFSTVSEAAKKYTPTAPLNVPFPISWADEERDTSAWLGNELQNEAFSKLYSIRDRVLATEDDEIMADYLRLQESDHFYYMCTKFFSDGSVHSYFNPYATPYEAFINYMNVLSDFMLRVDKILRIDYRE
ncbi:MAG: glycoside hydrolase family 57 protein [Bacteroidales bacterium]